MYCPKCQKEVNDDLQVCPSCGSALESETENTVSEENTAFENEEIHAIEEKTMEEEADDAVKEIDGNDVDAKDIEANDAEKALIAENDVLSYEEQTDAPKPKSKLKVFVPIVSAVLVLLVAFSAWYFFLRKEGKEIPKEEKKLEEISEGELKFYCTIQARQYSMYGQPMDWDQEVNALTGKTMGEYMKDEVLDQLKAIHVIAGQAKQYKVTLDDKDLDAVKDYKQSIVELFGGESSYKESLQKMSLSDKQVEKILERQFLASKVQETVMHDDVAKHYENHYYKAKHILILADQQGEEEGADSGQDPKERAEEILTRLEAGEDFDALMNELSEDPGLSTNPDGYVFTDGKMVPEFEEAVKSLKPGEYTKELVQTDYGYHIIMRVELTGEDEDFDKNFSQYLSEFNMTDRKWAKLYKKWEAEAKIKVDEKMYEKINFKDFFDESN